MTYRVAPLLKIILFNRWNSHCTGGWYTCWYIQSGTMLVPGRGRPSSSILGVWWGRVWCSDVAELPLECGPESR